MILVTKYQEKQDRLLFPTMKTFALKKNFKVIRSIFCRILPPFRPNTTNTTFLRLQRSNPYRLSNKNLKLQLQQSFFSTVCNANSEGRWSGGREKYRRWAKI